MKKFLFVIASFLFIFSSAQFFNKETKIGLMNNREELEANFIALESSIYDPRDVFGLLAFLIQERNGTFNYEIAGLTWDDMATAISGNPDETIGKIKNARGEQACEWKTVNGIKVLSKLDLGWKEPASVFAKFFGNLDCQYFLNLEYLDISVNNYIYSVNLIKNVKLTYLNVKHTSMGWNGGSLDVSKNTLLEYLNCSATYLVDLDITNNTKIKELDCSWNSLSNLDLSQNIDLIIVNCAVNKIESAINLSNSNLLQEVYVYSNKIPVLDLSNANNVKILNAGTNQLEAIDITHMPKLWSLQIGQNNLTSLDVSQNLLLETIRASYNNLVVLDISNNLLLKNLDCNYNSLEMLDTSNNIVLEALECNNNNLNELDVTNNTILKYLYCNSNNLADLDLTNNLQLRGVFCENNKLETLFAVESLNFRDFRFSKNNLKLSTIPQGWSNLINYIYYPQNTWMGGIKGYFQLIDLSSEYNIKGNITTYQWFDKATGQEVTMFASNGTFYASPTNAGKTLLCKMTNAQFPNLILEYEVTITNNMAENTSIRIMNINDLLEGFRLMEPDADSQNISIAPNPVTDILKINSSSPAKSIIVYDYSGREVKRINSIINNQVNVQDLPSGNYILNIQTDQGTVTKKMIKK